MSFQGKKVLITAGPTQEAIDPVRYISNHSSGKMGLALANHFINEGAEVTLVLGPTALNPDTSKINVINVINAEDMYQACIQYFPESDIAILAAAVADYTPKIVANQKIKKKTDEFSIELVKTKDILKSLGATKSDHQTLVGFALETNNELENAKAKLENKKADMIVLNSLADDQSGFGHNTNKITIIDRKGEMNAFPLKSKLEVAEDICQYLNTFIETNIKHV